MPTKTGSTSTITISKELYYRLRTYCKMNGYCISKIVSLLIENKIKDGIIGDK